MGNQIDHAARRKIAEAILGDIDERGFCVCPGVDLHSRKGVMRPGRPGRECRVFLERVPTIYCCHTSCEAAVAEANKKLRSQIGKHEARASGASDLPQRPSKFVKRSREEVDAERKARKNLALAVRVEASRDAIVREWDWPIETMIEGSPVSFESEQEEARAILGLFKPNDIVWCGRFGDSIAAEDVDDAKPERVRQVKACFRSATEWLDLPGLVGPRICPSAFRAGSVSRSNDTILHRRFLVVEHDSVGLSGQAAMLRWLWLGAGLTLRAVVFTGGKSLHGWFDVPPSGQMEELQVTLCGVRVDDGGKRISRGGLGFDPATFKPSQPYRLPGWKHDGTGKVARLFYFNGGAR